MGTSNDSGIAYLYRIAAAAAIVWTVTVIGSASWNIYNERTQTLELARKEAISNFNKDMAFRLWGTKHGGVYVPPTAQTPPNPYLGHIPDRDITLPSGKRLTLMNPAYMVRQMMNDFADLYGVKGRITSLKPLNPANAPDAWEREALTAFENGTKEYFETSEHDGQRSLRLMRPMATQAGCLKCHAWQGYKVGDIRGGVGVNVPMSPYLALEKKAVEAIILSHIAIWLLGSTILGLLFAKGKRFIIERAISHEALMRSEEALREQERYTQSLLRLSRRLESARNHDEVLTAARDEVSAIIGYQNLWAYLFTEDKKHAKALMAAGPMAETVMSEEGTATLTIKGDRMLEEIAEAKGIVVVEDARTDERTDKQIVARMGNRTIVNVPIFLLDRHLGSVGMGTFGDEGIRIPTKYEQEYLVALASHMAVTLDRIHLFDERVRAEEMLRKNNEVVEKIFAMTTTCIAYMDRDFNFIRVNKMYADADWKEPEYFIGKNHFELFPNAENEAIFRKAVGTGEQHIAKAKPFEYKLNPERGTTHWDWSLTPIRNQCGEVEAVLLSLVNVSERIIAQEELRELNKELEQRVMERTTELQEKNAELERMNRMFVGRELRMIELKKRIRILERNAEELAE